MYIVYIGIKTPFYYKYLMVFRQSKSMTKTRYP